MLNVNITNTQNVVIFVAITQKPLSKGKKGKTNTYFKFLLMILLVIVM